MLQPQPYDELDAADLLALLVFREARGEPDTGKLAVAYSPINRVSRPGWWGKTIHEAILKPFQYSSFNEDDPNNIWPVKEEDQESWKACQKAAQDAIGGVMDPSDGATHFHPDYVEFPKGWGDPSKFERTLFFGKHYFYKEVV